MKQTPNENPQKQLFSIKKFKQSNRQKKFINIQQKYNNLVNKTTNNNELFSNVKINDLAEKMKDVEQNSINNNKTPRRQFLTPRNLVDSKDLKQKIHKVKQISIYVDDEIRNGFGYGKQTVKQAMTTRDNTKVLNSFSMTHRQIQNKTAMAKFTNVQNTRHRTFFSFREKIKSGQKVAKKEEQQAPAPQSDIIDRPLTKLYSSIQQLQKYNGKTLQQLKLTKKDQNTTHQQPQSNLSNLSTLFLVQYQKLTKTKNRQWLNNTVLTEQQKRNKITTQSMKIMEYLLEQQDNKLYDINQLIQYQKNEQIKRLYTHSHILYEKFMEIKKQLQVHQIQYASYLTRLKQQQNDRKQMLLTKRQSSNNYKNKNQQNFKKFTAGFNNMNINDKSIKQMMQKKSKLNLQFDLSYQIQQRKKVAKEKEAFKQKKNDLMAEKESIQKKIKSIKQKIQTKQKQIQGLEEKKQKMDKQREQFLKMLIKNTEYRLDGIMWTLKKIIQYGYQLKKEDFSNQIDQSGRQFILEEYKRMKKENIFQFRPMKRKLKRQVVKRNEKPRNRQRVKSMTIVKQENIDQSQLGFDFSEGGQQQTIKKGSFFTFGSKLLQGPKQGPSIRKKSGSVQIRKACQQASKNFQDQSTKSIAGNDNFKSITKIENRKKIYQSSQNYIKNWVNRQGWKSLSSKNIQKPTQQTISQQFMQDEKNRIKRRYFKIGTANTKYNTMVKTIFGTQQPMQITKRLKTSR